MLLPGQGNSNSMQARKSAAANRLDTACAPQIIDSLNRTSTFYAAANMAKALMVCRQLGCRQPGKLIGSTEAKAGASCCISAYAHVDPSDGPTGNARYI